MTLAGRGAVVTGGGRGIGAAVARALAAAGAYVIVAARTEAEVEQVARELTEAGHRAAPMTCDVSSERDVTALARRAEEVLGAVDVLVNNAGTASSAPFPRLSLAEWNRLLAVNATGTFLCTRALLPGMVDRGWGRVVNVASVAGLKGERYVTGYTAAKHAVVGLTRALAAEVASHGVTVNAVCPGYVNTPMTDATLRHISEKTGRSLDEARAAVLATNPQGRLIEPGEVARAVLGLCDEAAGGINGQAIVIDGGGLLA